MTEQEAYKAAFGLQKFCAETRCEKCIFRTGRRGDVMIGCRLCEDITPRFWELRYAKRRAKE